MGPWTTSGLRRTQGLRLGFDKGIAFAASVGSASCVILKSTLEAQALGPCVTVLSDNLMLVLVPRIPWYYESALVPRIPWYYESALLLLICFKEMRGSLNAGKGGFAWQKSTRKQFKGEQQLTCIVEVNLMVFANQPSCFRSKRNEAARDFRRGEFVFPKNARRRTQRKSKLKDVHCGKAEVVACVQQSRSRVRA
jgi:hypothetical protein